MEEKQIYVAERNNYFFGKLMTARDFESEQTYFNSKRRLGNKILNGAGIVAGLDLVLIDNKTFSLDSGLAIDYEGREIVVPESVVKRLNVLPGFEENKDQGIVYLCLGYKEEPKESTFSVAGSGSKSGISSEFNRIVEGYELFLTAKAPSEEELSLDELVKQRVNIYERDGVKISLIVDKFVNPGKNLNVVALFEKENMEAPVKFSFNLSGEFFKSTNNEALIPIEYSETELSTYKNIKKEYSVFCNATSDVEAELILRKSDFNLTLGEDKFEIPEDVKIPVSIKAASIEDLIVSAYYSKNFDDIIENNEGKFIYLAKIHLVSNQLSYFIESFEKHPFKQYLFSNELLNLLQKSSRNREGVLQSDEIKFISSSPETVETSKENKFTKIQNNINTGVERINLGFNPKVGKPFYSYEFVHGLGEGNIGVIVAIDNKANSLTDDKGLLVFGEKEIFANEEITISAPNVAIGAIVNSEKGTIRLGVALKEKTNAQAVDIRWWAFKPVETVEDTEDLVIDENVRVVISPNTVRIKPLEQIRFEAKIEGAISQEVRWALAEDGSGTIDNNGLYTAPSKEGVYEIKAFSVKFEGKSDAAYIVVSANEN